MASYKSSADNRFYAALETSYGQVPAVTGSNRFPATGFQLSQERAKVERRDKTGSRSRGIAMQEVLRDTGFRIDTYHVTRQSGTQQPSYGPLIQAALGATPAVWSGGIVDSIPGANQIRLAAAHNLSAGQAITFGGEIRFVIATPDATTVELNAAFSVLPSNGSPIGGSVSYALGKTLPSLSLFDYWSPDSAVQRLARGCVVDRMKVSVNGDFHELRFEGMSADLLDSSSFAAGQGGLTAFPVEPTIAPLAYSPVPGHLGQVWLGALSERFYTLTEATVQVNNNAQLRNREFGSSTARGHSAGRRDVTLSFSMYEQDDTATRALYQAARNRQPIQAMFQLGTQQGHLLGLYMKGVVPEVPEFDDRETQVRWKFGPGQAHGIAEDELYVSFG